MREIVSRSDIKRLKEELGPTQVPKQPESAPAEGSDDNVDTATNHRARIAAGADKYTARLIKYIPAEVIALYLALLGILEASGRSGSEALQWLIFVFCLVGTYFYLKRVTRVSKKTQLILSTLAFVVWAFSLQGPFILYDWYDPLYGALLLPMFTFAIPIVEP